MPWIDAAKSDFVEALEYFWNSWGALQDDVMLIASGSATSWMNDKLVANKGGLHARITKQIVLEPFSLKEVEEYLTCAGAHWAPLPNRPNLYGAGWCAFLPQSA